MYVIFQHIDFLTAESSRKTTQDLGLNLKGFVRKRVGLYAMQMRLKYVINKIMSVIKLVRT